MLVLSRRPSEKLLFPSLQTTVAVLSIKPTVVRLGVEAPDDVVVLRAELRPEGLAAPGPHPAAGPGGLRPSVRNRLNNLLLGVALLRRQVRASLGAGALAALEKMDAELEALGRQLDALGDEPAEIAPCRG